MRDEVEILAPAGSYDSLRAAVNAGADAVYIGGAKFGARAYADNPDEATLLKAIDYVHLYNKKIYLTVNTLLKNNEIKEELYNYLLPYYEAGLDAVIVQDLGVLKCIKECFPDIDIHASTQMTITGSDGAWLLKELGASRIVTARELSVKEISEIHNFCDIEIESFVHGALCYCYSGQCLMSSMLGGRSGNRGRCAQPCRLPYDVVNKGLVVNKKDSQYILSPKDMCTLNILPQIIDAGVYSLKIEGRMKSPQYTAGVVSMYRKYVDLYLKKGISGYMVSDEDYNTLEQLYSRSGFNEGYYNQHNGRNMITFSKPSYSGQNEQIIEQINEKYINKNKKIKIDGEISILPDKEIELELRYKDNIVKVYGEKPLEAIKRPADKEMVTKQLMKTGSTAFEFEHIKVNIEGNVFVQIKDLNNLRREALEAIENQIISKHKREAGRKAASYNAKQRCLKDMQLNCMVSNKKQFEIAAAYENISWIYVSYDFMEVINEDVKYAHSNGKKVALVMPYIFRDEAKKYFDKRILEIQSAYFDAIMVRNLDEIHYIRTNFPNMSMIFDYYLYTFNDYAYDIQKELGAAKVTEHLENNYKELRNMDRNIGEIIVYGYIPLMVTAGCINKNLSACSKGMEDYKLIDRYKTQFKVKNICKYCYNLIYNSVPISLLSVSEDIKKLYPESIRLQFTDENKEEMLKILDTYSGRYFYNKKIDEIQNSTRGHFKRGVE